MSEGCYEEEGNVLESPPTISRDNLFRESLDVNMNFFNQVVKHILNEGLDALASTTQQCSNTKRSMVVWMNPTKLISLNSGKSSISHSTENHGVNAMSEVSCFVSLFFVIFQLSKKLVTEREQWKQQKK